MLPVVDKKLWGKISSLEGIVFKNNIYYCDIFVVSCPCILFRSSFPSQNTQLRLPQIQQILRMFKDLAESSLSVRKYDTHSGKSFLRLFIGDLK